MSGPVSVSGVCYPLRRQAAQWRSKLAEVDSSAGLCPHLEGRALKMRATKKGSAEGKRAEPFAGKYAPGSPACLSQAPPPRAEWPKSSTAAAHRIESRLHADPVSPRGPSDFLAQWQGWLRSAGDPFLRPSPQGKWFPVLISAGVDRDEQSIGSLAHLLGGKGSEHPTLRCRFECFARVLRSCAEALRVGNTGRDRKLSVSCCSAQKCGRGFCAI